MASKILLDTNILIDIISAAYDKDEFSLRDEVVCIPIISIGELMSGFELGYFGMNSLEKIIRYPIYNIDMETAQVFGKIVSENPKFARRHYNDVWISAIGIRYNLSLCTRNDDDFALCYEDRTNEYYSVAGAEEVSIS
ncbi:MAG TPA: type II toxin-antitoxin system VapC family toxin [Caldisericia bacterium]|nr:type II toxin-antitoxin system VapC family toxin [Caldisericia bacterium]